MSVEQILIEMRLAKQAMTTELQQLMTNYNEAVDAYNLARLEYAMGCSAPTPAPVRHMGDGKFSLAFDAQAAAFAVEAVRDFFEDVAEGVLSADHDSPAFFRLEAAAVELTRKFFHVSLTRLGVSCRGIISDIDAV